jgi:hypothetical protein
MKTNTNLIKAELLDSDALPSGHCAVKVLVRDCDGVEPGDVLEVVAYEVKDDGQ